MNTAKKSFLLRAALAILMSCYVFFVVPSEGQAAKSVTLPKREWSFSGLFGTFDRASAQRGFQVYREICAGCHSLDLIAFRNLSGLGYTEGQIKEFAAEYEIEDGPNEEGEFFTRPGRPADYFPSPYSNKKAAAAANNGKAPPDLSLITKARAGGGDSSIRYSLKNPGGYALGADYLFALLIGYEEPPEDFEGDNYNRYFPGGSIAMAQPIEDESVEYSDGTEASLQQIALDVTTFLAWAAEPELEARKRLGIKVILFLAFLTALLYVLKRKIWSDIH